MSAEPVEPGLSPIKKALLEIRDLRARLHAAESARSDPIAVVGMGLRLPGGVHDEATLWSVLAEGRDTIGPIPEGRWNVDNYHDDDADHPGTMWTRDGGFLDGDPADFDAAFFGIAPLEAASMDPQQRIMLELAWHALEDAGIAPDSLASSRTGVFIGVGNSDYGRALLTDTDRIDAYSGSGGSVAVLAGRIAYVLGLQGPALTVDTACSASLVAVHLACRSLRTGECDLALVGGINLILSPAAHIAFTKARMMSRDGRCKPFDGSADGYGRGEGGVLLVLQRERDAVAQGARQLARIRGSAINQDGRSGGLTAPSGPQQAAVIRAALDDARLGAADIDAIEAHGTGTPLGDPIELHALGQALGAGRPANQPLWVSSCKSNFGHLEAAAGLAGLAKVIVSLRQRQMPPHLHFRNPNPLVDWAALPIAVPTRLQPWPQRVDDGPARAGVSSFGFSGTNAHVIVEEAPRATVIDEIAVRPWQVLLLSARDARSLRDLAGRWHDRLTEPDAETALPDLCFTAATGRASLPHRLAIRGADAASLRSALRGWLDGRTQVSQLAAQSPSRPPKVAFVFTGQGAQYSGMGAGLYERAPAFRAKLDQCAATLDTLLDVPLKELLFDPRQALRLADTAYCQPALFAFEVALAALWRALGVTPTVVLGHSLGEYAAACVAGILPLEDALRALVQRGRLTADLPSDGAMVSVQAGAAELHLRLDSLGEGIEVAAYNGARRTVLSGERASLDRVTAALDAAGTHWRALNISQAFHSACIEPALAPYGEVLAGVRFGNPTCAIVSNVRGALAEAGEMAQPSYWLRQMRVPVRFADGLRALIAEGVTHVVEIGPQPVLIGLGAEELPDSPVAWLPSLRRDDDANLDLAESLQRLHVDGMRIDLTALDRASRRRVAAPLTPFQRSRHWLEGWHDGGRTRASFDGDGRHVWDCMAAALARNCDQVPVGVDISGYDEHWATLEGLTVAHATAVMREVGLFVQAGEAHDGESVRARLGAKPIYAQLLRCWLDRLADRGDLRRVQEASGRTLYISDQPLPVPDLEHYREAARRALSNDPHHLEYLLHCSRLLSAVIRGHESPLETLFPGGSFALAESIYTRSTPMRYINALAASAVETIIAARGRAPIRVMEIGGGTGGTTSSVMGVLRDLPPERVSYLFTDVTSVFLDRARANYADIPFFDVATFDFERDPAEQGIATGTFDLVIAANAIHAAHDLRAALARVRSLVAPGGVLLLVESTAHLAWYDITTGLIEGWQHFADDLRTDNPLLPSATWQAALTDAGFGATGAWPPPEHPAARLGQQVIAAWVAGRASTGDAQALPIVRQPTATTTAPDPASNDLLQRLADATPDEQCDLLREALRDAVQGTLHLPSPPARHDRLMELGMDSLMAIQLRNRIAKLLGLTKPLPATLMFDQPTIETLAVYLQKCLSSTTTAASTEAEQVSTPRNVPLGAERVAEMSDEEIEALLLAKMEQSR